MNKLIAASLLVLSTACAANPKPNLKCDDYELISEKWGKTELKADSTEYIFPMLTIRVPGSPVRVAVNDGINILKFTDSSFIAFYHTANARVFDSNWNEKWFDSNLSTFYLNAFTKQTHEDNLLNNNLNAVRCIYSLSNTVVKQFEKDEVGFFLLHTSDDRTDFDALIYTKTGSRALLKASFGGMSKDKMYSILFSLTKR